MGLDRVEDQVGDLVAPRVPARPSASSYGAYWQKTLITWWPGGADRAVVGRLEVELAEAERRLAAARRLARGLRSSIAVVIADLARSGSRLGRAAVKVGKRLSATFSFITGELTSQSLEPARGSRRAPPPSASSSIASSRFGSALQTTTGARIARRISSSTPSPGRIAATGTPAASSAPGLQRRLGDRERDPADAALDVAPHRAEAEQVALVVHEPDRRRARVARPGEGADRALAGDRVAAAARRRRSARASRRSTPRRRSRSAPGRRRAGASISSRLGDGRCQMSLGRRARSRSRIRSKTAPKSREALDVGARRSPGRAGTRPSWRRR